MDEVSEERERFVIELAGPAAAEVRALLADSSRPIRSARLRKLLDETECLLSARGLRPAPVPASVLLPILEYASVEDNELAGGAWAELLAKAAGQAEDLKITPVFAEIMRQLCPAEVKFLLHLPDIIRRENYTIAAEPELIAAQGVTLGTDVDLLIKYLQLGLGRPKNSREQALKNIPGDLRDFMAILDNLERLNLLCHVVENEAPGWGSSLSATGLDPVRVYQLTMLGYQFIRACSA